ncbi:MAG: hypothetical protein WBB74_11705 [Gaiellaceae bacterium]
MQEPGLDRHEWETEFTSLEEDLHESPDQALPELADLVERMLIARGFDLGEPVTFEGDDRDVVADYLAARDIANLTERGDADPGDVAQAIQNLREVYDFLLAERRAP